MSLTLDQLINPSQYACIMSLINESEEKEHYNLLLDKVTSTAFNIPKLYEQDGVKDPVYHFHYFNSYSDIYILELTDDRAFGYVNLGQGGELGYVNISEIVENNMELDLYFEPTKSSEVATS